MSTINISLSEALKNFADARVAGGEYGHGQVPRDPGRGQLRGLLLDGASSAPTSPVERDYFDGLRARARRHRAA